jgi:hypothetical protein
VKGYVEHYNDGPLNSAIGYITPKDILAGRPQEIHAERDRKLEDARKQRRIRRQQPAEKKGPIGINHLSPSAVLGQLGADNNPDSGW